MMLHAKFQNHRPTGSGEEDFLKVFAIYSHGGHLGHVTWTIYIHFCSSLLRMLDMKFDFHWPIGQAVSEMKIFEYSGNRHIYCPRPGADQPLGSNFFQKKKKKKKKSICPFPSSFSLQMTF